MAGLTACLFLSIIYLVMNCRWSVSGEKLTLKYVDLALTKLRGYDKLSDMSDSVLVIDVHYDKQLVMEHDEAGNPLGLVPVTDRDKLFRLLSKLDSAGNYKYIMLDVAFMAQDRQPEDSLLYNLIKSMRKITIPKPMGSDIADVSLLESGKVGTAQYGTTIWENDFVKYPYYTDDEESMPLIMFEELQGIKNKKFFRHYHRQGGRLIRNSVIQTLDFRITTIQEVMNGALPVNVPLDLGVGILGIEPDGTRHDAYSDNEDWAKGKYILIGDFEGDTHTTYRGEMPGTAINFNAYLSLLYGQQYVSYTFMFILLLFFYFQNYLIITRQNVYEVARRHYDDRALKSGFLRAVVLKTAKVCSVLGYPVFSVVICIMTFYVFGQVYDVFLIITLLFILKKTVDAVNKFKSLKADNNA